MIFERSRSKIISELDEIFRWEDHEVVVVWPRDDWVVYQMHSDLVEDRVTSSVPSVEAKLKEVNHFIDADMVYAVEDT